MAGRPTSRRAARARRLAALAALALVTAACGSTVTGSERLAAENGQFGTDGGTSVDGSGGPSGDGSTSGGGTTVTGGSGGRGRGAGGTRGTGNGTRTTTRDPKKTDGGGGKGPTSGRGFTATELFLGYATSKDAEQAGEAFGAELSFGDTETQVRAILDDINRRGGIHGRKVRPIFHDVNAVEGNRDPSTAAEKACTDWTQDRPVFAILNAAVAVNEETLFQCAKKAGTPLVLGGMTQLDATVLNQYSGYMYLPRLVTWNRLIPVWVERLVAQGYFNEGYRLGLLTTDNPMYERVDALLERELAKHGLAIHDRFAGSDGLDALSEFGTAAFQFKQKNITHVIGYGTRFFAETAEANGHSFRYAVTSYDLTSDMNGKARYANAAGVGFDPALDVGQAQAPPQNEASKRCLEIMKAVGQEPQSATWRFVEEILCDMSFFFEQAINAGGELSAASLRRGVELLGTRFQASGLFGTQFGPGRYDGAAVVRDLYYDGGCSCWKYRGPLTPLP